MINQKNIQRCNRKS